MGMRMQRKYVFVCGSWFYHIFYMLCESSGAFYQMMGFLFPMLI